jgi:hypothetical protein
MIDRRILRKNMWLGQHQETNVEKVCVTVKEDDITNMDEYFEGVSKALNQYEGIDFSNLAKLVVILILNSFPSQYDLLVKTSMSSLPALEELE